MSGLRFCICLQKTPPFVRRSRHREQRQLRAQPAAGEADLPAVGNQSAGQGQQSRGRRCVLAREAGGRAGLCF